MPRNRHDNQERDAVSGELRRLAGSAGNQRALRALPQFRLDPRLPGDMEQLLERLDRAEASDPR
jgi:hypothetical protein